MGQCTWIANGLNILVLGPTGLGKTFAACSLATAAVRQGYSARHFRTSRLLYSLGQAHQDASFSTLLRSLARIQLLILDDWMRDALTQANAQDLLEILDDRFGHTSTLVVSQMPVNEWFGQIPSPTLADAILDRLVNNAYRLQLSGESQRRLRSSIRSMPHS